MLFMRKSFSKKAITLSFFPVLYWPGKKGFFIIGLAMITGDALLVFVGLVRLLARTEQLY